MRLAASTARLRTAWPGLARAAAHKVARLAAMLAAAGAVQAQPAAGVIGASHVFSAEREQACAELIPDPWPRGVVERRLHLRRLDAARESCIDAPAFLAALGALWLEDGDPVQARVWLERALMLDPDRPGAQADHALALAALGEPTALRELERAWRHRGDVPTALRRRLQTALEPALALHLPDARLGGDVIAVARRASRGEAQLLLGYDSNLSFAPRLSELTLTPPEGPVVLPVVSRPRRAAAVKADLSWQAAWSAQEGELLRAGLSASTRHAPGESATDWAQLRTALAYSRQWNGWSAQSQIDGAWFGGPLTEPYGLLRGLVGLEHRGQACALATQFELTRRRQHRTRSADSTSRLVNVRLLCRPDDGRDWSWSLGAHVAVDEPRSIDRPGGTQRSQGLVLRVEYRPNALLSVHLGAGLLRVHDRDGYSPLIEQNAVRAQLQRFTTLELNRAVNLSALPGAEAVLQLAHYRQASNLALFQREGLTAYGGLRWPW